MHADTARELTAATAPLQQTVEAVQNAVGTNENGEPVKVDDRLRTIMGQDFPTVAPGRRWPMANRAIFERLAAMDIARAERGLVIDQMQQELSTVSSRIVDAINALIGGTLPSTLDTLKELVEHIQADETGLAALLAAQNADRARFAPLESAVAALPDQLSAKANASTVQGLSLRVGTVEGVLPTKADKTAVTAAQATADAAKTTADAAAASAAQSATKADAAVASANTASTAATTAQTAATASATSASAAQTAANTAAANAGTAQTAATASAASASTASTAATNSAASATSASNAATSAAASATTANTAATNSAASAATASTAATNSAASAASANTAATNSAASATAAQAAATAAQNALAAELARKRTKRVLTPAMLVSSNPVVNVTWDTPFADSNYTLQATLESSNSALYGIVPTITAKSATGASVTLKILLALAAGAGTVHFTAIHD